MTYKVHYIDEYPCLLSEKAFLKQKTAKTTHPLLQYGLQRYQRKAKLHY